MSESPAVTAEGLTRRFGDFTAVDGVSFEVGVGEVFGFLGPNGAGKTTTIKMLSGLLSPTEGRAVVAGHDVASERRLLKRDIGYMSQLFSLYLDLTVEENIELFAGLYEVRGPRFEQRRDWVLSMAGLEEARRRRTGQLPLGWKQRLALGCAVLHEPPVLFLDEPTSGVDPAARRAFWDMIYGLAEQGTTVLVSTHYMEEAEYCGRVALMNRGRLIALDRPAALRAELAEPILELRTDDAARAVEALKGAEGVIEAAMFGRRVHVAAEDEARAGAAIRNRLSRAGLALERIERIDPSLEDVFVSLVRREGGTVAG
jgi:ABC-2 type transport system ATP-binding protein